MSGLRGFRGVWWVVVILLGVSCSEEPEPAGGGAVGCRLNSDCALGLVCQEGACVEATPCEGAACPCASDAGCGPGMRCDAGAGLCVEVECLSDAGCALGEVCALGQCLADVNADRDRDGVPDGSAENPRDNCPDRPNTEQEDLDGDGDGDVCDMDRDGDGANDDADNCPLATNAAQEDEDGNGIGDACEGDRDFDGVRDDRDACPTISDPDQADLDDDGMGDACDGDDDGDGAADNADSCPRAANADQSDRDGNGVGDACEGDRDSDGVPDDLDRCPQLPDPDQADLDDDGVGDRCDLDRDGDGVDDDLDNCRLVANAEQTDRDSDGQGDACEGDQDNDGVGDDLDNCLDAANPDQDDADLDRVGDACDGDDDNDGVVDAEDNCALVGNPSQADVDGNGVGNVCDAGFSGVTIEGRLLIAENSLGAFDPVEGFSGAVVTLEGPETDTALPDEEGRFAFGGVRGEGRYDLVVRWAGWSVGRGTVFVDLTMPVYSRELVAIHQSQLGATSQTLRGQVVLEDQVDHSGVVVRVRRNGDLFATTLTDAAGDFSLQASPMERYTVELAREGFVEGAFRAPVVWSDDALRFVLDEANPVEPPPVTLAWDRSARISAQLVSTRGDTAFGDVVARAECIAGVCPGGSAALAVDAGGALSGADLVPGLYQVELTLSGYLPWTRTLSLGRGDNDFGEITLVHESETINAVPLGGRATLDGQTSHAGITVRVYREPDHVLFGATLTDAAGDFSLLAARLERYSLALSAPGYVAQTPANVYAWSAEAGRFEDESGGTPEVLLRREQTASASGQLTATYPNTPFVNALVDLRCLDARCTGLAPRLPVSSDGRFSGAMLAPGLYELAVTLSGFVPVNRVVELTSNANDLGAIALTHESESAAAVSLAGRVDLAGRSDDGGVVVQLYRNDLPFASTVTDSAGNFAVSASRFEQYTLAASSAGFVARTNIGPLVWDEADGRFELSSAAVVVVLTQDTSASLSGSLTATVPPSSWTLAQVTATCLSPWCAATPVNLPVNAAGAFSATGLAPGIYELRVLLAGYVPASRTLNLVSGANAIGAIALTHDAETAAAVPLAGQVRLSAGSDYSGTVIYVRQFGNPTLFASTLTDTSGYFSTLASRSTSYTVEAVRPGFAAQTLEPAVWDAVDGRFEVNGSALNVTLAEQPLNGSITARLSALPAWVPAAELSFTVVATGLTTPYSDTRTLTAGGASAIFPGLRAGTYELNIARAGFSAVRQIVTLTPEQPTPSVVLGAAITDLRAAAMNLRGVTLTAANLTGVPGLRGADLSGVVLSGSWECFDFTGVILNEINAMGISLRGAIFQSASLRAANLAGANLQPRASNCARASDPRSTIFTNAELGNANLSGATMQVTAPMTPCAALTNAVRMGGANLIGANFGGANMAGINLTNNLLSLTILTGANLSSACLEFASMDLVDLTDVTFSSADLSDASLSGALLKNVTGTAAELTRADLNGALLTNASLTNAILIEARLNGAQITGGSLAGANLTDASLLTASLTSTNLTGADFAPSLMVAAVLDSVNATSARFDGAKMQSVRIIGTVPLTGATFHDADLRLADLTNIDMTGVGAQRIQLQSASLAAANFTLADLTMANLDLSRAYGVVFDGTNLSGASLVRADLRGARFERSAAPITATNLSGADLSYASCVGCSFAYTDLSDATAIAADFSNAEINDVTATNLSADADGSYRTRFVSADIDDSSFVQADLGGADFQGAFLDDLDLTMAGLVGALFDGARILDVTLAGANVLSASFTSTHIDGASFFGAQSANSLDFSFSTIEDADFRLVDLRSSSFDRVRFGPSSGSGFPVEFQGANLEFTLFSDADIAFTSFAGADIDGIDLDGAQLSYVDLAGVRGVFDEVVWGEAFQRVGLASGSICPDGRRIEDFSPGFDCVGHARVTGFLVMPHVSTRVPGFTSTGVQSTSTGTGLTSADPVWDLPTAACADGGGAEDHYFNVVVLVNPTAAPIFTTVDVTFSGGGNGFAHEFSAGWDSDLVSSCVKGNDNYDGDVARSRLIPVDVPARSSRAIVLSSTTGGAAISGGYTFQVANGIMYEAEGPEYQHQRGRAEAEGWSADPALDASGYLAVGPYINTIPAGALEAVFRLQSNNVTGTTNVVAIDVWDNTGMTRLAGPVNLTRADFVTANAYREFALPYTAPAPGPSMEYRVQFLDTTYVRFDRAYIRRVVP